MSQAGYVAITISVLVVLAVFVVWSFLKLKRMPAPKGCEDLEANKAKCSGCGEIACPIYSKYHEEEE